MMFLKRKLTEDWAVVAMGFILILVAVWGMTIPMPAYKWADGESLGGLLAGANLQRVAGQFALSYALMIAGAALTGNSIRPQLLGFPLVFALTVVALLLAGNRFLNDLGLEAVIFGLFIGLIVGNLFRLPDWFRRSLNAEMLVKVGLVLLGTSVIF